MNKTITLTFLTFIFLFPNCKQKDWREEIQPIDWKVLHKDLIAKQKVDFEIQGGRPTPEALLKDFFQELSQKDVSSNWSEFLLSQDEYENYFMPHTLGFGTSLDSTPLDSYLPILRERREQGLQKLKGSLDRNKGFELELKMNSSVRTFGPWIGKKPELVLVKTKQGSMEIEQIKQIVQYKGKWKIAVIAP